VLGLHCPQKTSSNLELSREAPGNFLSAVGMAGLQNQHNTVSRTFASGTMKRPLSTYLFSFGFKPNMR
jgi:hypothetical protein